MNENTLSHFTRTEFLSLNTRELKKTIHDASDKNTLLNPNQSSVGQLKIGKSPLKLTSWDFCLDDPDMHRSRYCVEYHRLQDPFLRRFLKSTSIRKRLQDLKMVSKNNEIICSAKELAEYLRFVNHVNAHRKDKNLKEEIDVKLLNNLKKMADAKITNRSYEVEINRKWKINQNSDTRKFVIINIYLQVYLSFFLRISLNRRKWSNFSFRNKKCRKSASNDGFEMSKIPSMERATEQTIQNTQNADVKKFKNRESEEKSVHKKFLIRQNELK